MDGYVLYHSADCEGMSDENHSSSYMERWKEHQVTVSEHIQLTNDARDILTVMRMK